jgi:hypothetical protein
MGKRNAMYKICLVWLTKGASGVINFAAPLALSNGYIASM